MRSVQDGADQATLVVVFHERRADEVRRNVRAFCRSTVATATIRGKNGCTALYRRRVFLRNPDGCIRRTHSGIAAYRDLGRLRRLALRVADSRGQKPNDAHAAIFPFI
jgi:hypothetical protein